MPLQRLISLVFCTLIFLNVSLGQNVVFPLVKELKGSVKSIKEVSYTAVIKAGKVVKGVQVKKSNYLLDTKNNLIEKDDYDSAGAILKRYVANYDANENPTEEMLYTPDSVISKYKYRYDNKNNRIGWMSFTMVDTAIARGSYHYDDKGRITSDSLFDAKGKLAQCSNFVFEGDNLVKESHLSHGEHFTDTYEFDMDGNRIQDTKMAADGSTASVSRLRYNSDGKLTAIDNLTAENDNYRPVEKKQYDDAGRITRLTRYLVSGTSDNFLKYDSAGNIVFDSTFFDGLTAAISKQTYKYNNHKDTLEKVSYLGNNIQEKHTCVYDIKHNKVETDCEKGNTISKSVMEYDRLGNPVKEIIYLNGQPVSIIEREFVYY